jgi:1-phosphofructokinase family hexose kinase
MAGPPHVITVTLNPAIDQTLSIPGFAAGKVNRVAESRADAGGKGVNVASFLADLEIKVGVTGFLGVDNIGLFETLFERKRILDRFIRIDGSTRVGLKIVDGPTTTDVNLPGLTPAKEDLRKLLNQIVWLTEPGRWFVLAGSVPLGMRDNIYADLIELVHEQRGKAVLDTSGPPLREALAWHPDLVKPNMEELSELVGSPLRTPEEVRAAATSLLDHGVQRVVVSMGGDGAVFVERGQALLARPPAVTVRSTVGAGDAMVGGIVYAMLQDLPLEDVARWGTASGAYAVTRIGAGIENLAEHRKLIDKVVIERLQ